MRLKTALVAFTTIGLSATILITAGSAAPVSAGWCLLEDGTYEDVKSKINGGKKDCEDKDGAFLTNTQYNKLQNNSTGVFQPNVPNVGPPGAVDAGLGEDWFGIPQECTYLPTTRFDGNNVLADVYKAEGLELAAEIAYNIISNEPTGIAGAVLGGVLGGFSSTTYNLEWRYELQDECQEIRIRGINEDTNTKAAEILADADTIISDIASLGAALSVQTDEIDTALATLGAALTAQTDEIDTALAALSSKLTAETDEIDTALAALTTEIGANFETEVALYIEDHLDTCRTLVTFLVPVADGGLQETTFAVVQDLRDVVIAQGGATVQADRSISSALDELAADQPRKAFQTLCAAYNQLIGAVE